MVDILPPSIDPHYADSTITLFHQPEDGFSVLASLPDASVDAVVTDPPYGLEFMGKGWDSLGKGAPFQRWCEVWATECLRVLKPGGHLLAFGGTRTWHRLACAVEDAGFEVRDSLAWLYGSGFPKSLDVSKAIDKAAGAEREVVGTKTGRGARPRNDMRGGQYGSAPVELIDTSAVTAPATDAARTWQGWGTALKPAFEPVVMARKPLVGTVAANVLTHGTGALNIDGCRVDMNGEIVHTTRNTALGVMNDDGWQPQPGTFQSHASGRWPANVILDESQAEELDAQSGTLTSGKMLAGTKPKGERETYGQDAAAGYETQRDTPGDSGGASRFFYVAREDNEPCPNPEPANTVGSISSPPSAAVDSARSDAATSVHLDTDRQTGSPSTNGTPSASRPNGESDTPPMTSTGSASSPDWQPVKPSQKVNPARCAASLSQTDTTTTTTSPSTSDGSADPTTSSTTPNSVPGVPLDELGSRFKYVAKADASERVKVNGVAHPTVKPLAVMRWLVRLVTPPGGTVLEPFAGSGTTVEACILEGFDCIAIEREADYLPLIVQRIHRRRDPVEAVRGAGEDGGLFDLLGEASA